MATVLSLRFGRNQLKATDACRSSCPARTVCCQKSLLVPTARLGIGHRRHVLGRLDDRLRHRLRAVHPSLSGIVGLNDPNVQHRGQPNRHRHRQQAAVIQSSCAPVGQRDLDDTEHLTADLRRGAHGREPLEYLFYIVVG